MKYLFTALILSIGAVTAAEFSPNDGNTLPDTFTQKSNIPQKQEAKTASPVSSESGIINSSGIETDEMNTSPTPAPASDQEVLRNTTLSGKPVGGSGPDEIQAQEEDALDYSTAPDKKPSTPKKK